MHRGEWRPNESKVIPEDGLERLLRISEALAGEDVAAGRRSAVIRWATVNVACLAGLRVFEIAALTVGDLKLTGQRPFLQVQCGKGGKARTIALTGPLTELKDRLRRYLAWKRVVGEDTDNDAPLLASTYGGKTGHYTPDGLKVQFKRALEEAGIDPSSYSIHCGRHSAATYLYAKTRNLRLVQDILGHSSPTVTAGYAAIVDRWDALEEAGNGSMIGGREEQANDSSALDAFWG